MKPQILSLAFSLFIATLFISTSALAQTENGKALKLTLYGTRFIEVTEAGIENYSLNKRLKRKPGKELTPNNRKFINELYQFSVEDWQKMENDLKESGEICDAAGSITAALTENGQPYLFEFRLVPRCYPKEYTRKMNKLYNLFVDNK